MKNGIFISYRREDSEGFARGLFQSLTLHFGPDQVFMDVEDIELGLDFVEAIDKSLTSCGVLLVLIGKEWLSCVDEDGQPRLDNPEDFVRMEVASALRRNIRVIPVVVRGGVMPKPEQLPDELRPLTRRQALELHHDRWNADIEKLINALEKTLGIAPKAAPVFTPKPDVSQPESSGRTPKGSVKSGGWGMRLIGGVAAVVILVSGAALLLDSEPEPANDVVFTTAAEPEPRPMVEPRKDNVGVEAFSPAPMPESRRGPAPEMVEMVQELLTEMGYRPGPIDGQPGGQTHRAIQAFQRDRGLAPDGQVSERLVGILNEAFTQRQRSPAAGRMPAPSPIVNMTGTWYDDDGYQYFIVQEGNMIRYQATIPILGTAVGMGEGSLNGHALEYRYVVADGTQGTGRGTISEDGRHMNYVATDLGTGLQDSGTLHKEHMQQ